MSSSVKSSASSGQESRSLSGYPDNLNELQSYRLKEAYLAYLLLIGSAPKDAKIGIPFPKNSVPDAAPVQRSRFSLRSSAPAPAAEPFKSADCLREFQVVVKGLKPEQSKESFRSACSLDNPDAFMLRFLRARKWETPKALAQLGSTLEWRTNSGKINQLLERGEEYYIDVEPDAGFINQYKEGKVTLHGHDKQGRPLVFIHVAKHDPRAQSEEAMERYTLNLLESARLCLSKDVSTAAVIFDLSNFGLSNMDYAVVKFILTCFEHYYPECLGYLFIHRAPWVFSSVWAMIKGWIDPVVASKISFTNNEKDLLKFIDSNQIPEDMGGTSKFKYEWIPPKEGESKFTKDKEGKTKHIKEREDLFDQFDKATLKWILSTDKQSSTQAEQERNKIVDEIYAQYWHLDPYIRARCICDRNGSLGEFKPQLASGGISQPTL